MQNRRQTEERLLAVDPRDGSTTTLLVERDEAWLELDDDLPRWLAGGREFLWTTERNGARQLELRDRSGALVRALTEPAFGLQRVASVTPGGDAIVVGSPDPTQSQVWRVPLDPARGPAVQLTRDIGVHDVASRGDAPSLVLRSAPLRGEETFDVVTAAGDRKGRLRSVAEASGLEPRLELALVAESPAYHVALVRPQNFAKGQKYPVIVSVYGGPGAQTVRADRAAYLMHQWRADHGYIVVSIDGRGTPGRGREWARATLHDLIRVPLEDQVRALRALGARYPELDLDRVGIYGWSFGGYFSAMAVLREPAVFRAGVAGAPVVSWEDYDTHYTERYMGLPAENPEGYRAASVLTWADRLERPLLVIHGTADDNVYPLHSLKLADALFRAGRRAEFLPLVGFTHMVPEPAVRRRLEERIVAFFDENVKQPAAPR